MKSIIKLAAILVIISAALLLALSIAGVVSADQLWQDMNKILQLIGVGLIASLLVLYIGKS